MMPRLLLALALVTTIKQGGGRLDWSGRNNLIAFDQKDTGGFYQVYVMRPDGSGERCLTCGKAELPARHKGNPAWHPSGDYIVFQAERELEFPGPPAGRGHMRAKLQQLADETAEPGLGLHNDLWLTDSRGTRFWRLVEAARKGGGILHAHFSPSGDRLLWSERLGPGADWWGEWAIKLADFRMESGQPRLENIRSFRPGTRRKLFETHGFSRDGGRILFTAQPEGGPNDQGLDIYLFDLRTEALTNLTNSPEEWDEHAHFSPDGKKIVWVSSKGKPLPGKAVDLKADYWIMNPDGSGKRQLTYFNEPGHPESIEGGAAAGDFAWGPDGSRIAAYVIQNRRQGLTRMVMIQLERPQ